MVSYSTWKWQWFKKNSIADVKLLILHLSALFAGWLPDTNLPGAFEIQETRCRDKSPQLLLMTTESVFAHFWRSTNHFHSTAIALIKNFQNIITKVHESNRVKCIQDPNVPDSKGGRSLCGGEISQTKWLRNFKMVLSVKPRSGSIKRPIFS